MKRYFHMIFQEELQERKTEKVIIPPIPTRKPEISKINTIISNGANNIALAKAVQGNAYMCDAPGENMMDVGRWKYQEFVREMTVASIRTNLSTTILSWFSDTALKEIKNKTVIFQMNN